MPRDDPEDEVGWAQSAELHTQIDNLRHALSEALSYINELTEVMNMKLPRHFSKWSELLEPKSGEKR